MANEMFSVENGARGSSKKVGAFQHFFIFRSSIFQSYVVHPTASAGFLEHFVMLELRFFFSKPRCRDFRSSGRKTFFQSIGYLHILCKRNW